MKRSGAALKTELEVKCWQLKGQRGQLALQLVLSGTLLLEKNNQ